MLFIGPSIHISLLYLVNVEGWGCILASAAHMHYMRDRETLWMRCYGLTFTPMGNYESGLQLPQPACLQMCPGTTLPPRYSGISGS